MKLDIQLQKDASMHSLHVITSATVSGLDDRHSNIRPPSQSKCGSNKDQRGCYLAVPTGIISICFPVKNKNYLNPTLIGNRCS